MSDPDATTDMTDETLPPPLKETGAHALGRRSYGRMLYLFFASYGLATTCFFFMLVLTLLGTLEQQYSGIQEVTAKYFTSFGLIHEMRLPSPGGGDAFILPIPLPGGYLCMAVLFVNLLLGAMVRIRKDWKRAPMLLTHFAILLLMAGGWVTHHFAIDGAMQVFEGKESNYFADFTKWDVLVEKWDKEGDVPESAFVLPYEQIKAVKGESKRVFAPKDLPFEIEITRYLPNAVPGFRRGGEAAAKDGPASYDGFYLAGLELEKEAERNVPGMEVRILSKDGKSEVAKGLLWGLAREPFSFTSGEDHWVLRMDKRIYQVPFKIALDKFVKEEHPGIAMAKSFESYVRKIENGVEEEVHIYMNHPLRHEGYTFFQHSFGQGETTEINGATYSVFAVWKNPSDQWPLYSCVLVAFGLLAHFIMKLVLFLMRARKQPSLRAPSPQPEPAT